ncbi:MAG: carbamoyl transferase [bacterium]|nr:carbamoyl transferase [bacterium]
MLGINSVYHESAACLIRDGQIVAAVEEERFNRVKHAKSAQVDNPHELPVNAIDYCLKQAGIGLKDVDYIGYSFDPEARRNHTFGPEPVTVDSWGSAGGENIFRQQLEKVPGEFSRLAGEDMSGKFKWLDHHICHASSAFHVSPFEEAAILVADGIGEFSTTSLYKGNGNRISMIKRWVYPDSLGFLWEKLSKFLGFKGNEAAKVMGLAAYGNPLYYYDAFGQFVKIQEDGGYRIDNNITRFRVEDYSELEKLLGRKRAGGEGLEKRHKDIAAALQRVTEEILLSLSQTLHDETGSENLCIAGGVGLNCVANRVLQERGPFGNLYIQPATHDAGTAVGAAYYIRHQLLDRQRNFVMEDPYLGPGYTDTEIKAALDDPAFNGGGNLHYSFHRDIEKITAGLVAEGNVVGWFQGRMEIGPRALGNRTILADPGNPEMREILNVKVKHRETFRPFAPSVLKEKAGQWFEIHGDSLSLDYMLFAFDVKEDKRASIPAVLHVDGTGRLQTVRKELNPRYHKLIKSFEEITGVPILLNTSFNDSEPIICSPRDALATFLKTGIDYLVMENYLVARNDVPGNSRV